MKVATTSYDLGVSETAKLQQRHGARPAIILAIALWGLAACTGSGSYLGISQTSSTVPAELRDLAARAEDR